MWKVVKQAILYWANINAIMHGMAIRHYYHFRYLGRVKIGRKLRVYGCGTYIRCSLKGRITLGDNITIRNHTRANAVGVYKPCSFVAIGQGCLVVGDNVGFSGCSICVSKSINIENYCTIGANTHIVDTNFHSLDGSIRIQDVALQRDSLENASNARTVIAFNAFIGLNSIVLAGVRIGKESVVGAGSVVTRDIPDGQIWAGAPARYIRQIEAVK